MNTRQSMFLMFSTLLFLQNSTSFSDASPLQTSKSRDRRLQEFHTMRDFNAFIKSQQQRNNHKPFVFSYMTLNMCNSFEVQKNPALHAKYAWIQRLPRMRQLIEDEKPDIIGLQEVRNERDVYAVAELWKALAPLKYELVAFRNNPSDSAFINVIAYNKNKLALDNMQRWWTSETPERFSDSWGDGYGRVSLMATFYPIVMKNVRGQHVASPDYSHPAIHVVNAHRGLKHHERINAHKVDIQQVEKRVDQNNSVAFIGGDFNTFPDDKGPEEMRSLHDAGYRDLLSLKTHDGVAISGTFPGYPYDKFKSAKGTLGAQLDHIVCKPFGTAYTLAYYSYINAKKYKGTPEPKATCEADYLKAESSTQTEEDRDFPSDHLPGIVHMAVIKTPQSSGEAEKVSKDS